MFDLSGSKILFLIIIALVVLGPDKLPEAMRKAGKVYGDLKRMTSGFQNEMKSVLDEPMRELRETAELAKRSAMFDTSSLTESLSSIVKPQSGSMAAVTPVTPAAAAPPAVSTETVEPVEPVEPTSSIPEATPVPAPVETVIVETASVETVVVEPASVETVVVEPASVETVVVEPVRAPEPVSAPESFVPDAVSARPAVPAATAPTISDRTSRRLAGAATPTAAVRAIVEQTPESTTVVPAVETGVQRPVSEEASVE